MLSYKKIDDMRKMLTPTHTCLSEIIFIKGVVRVPRVGLLCYGVLRASYLEQIRVEEAECSHYELISHLNGVGERCLPRTVHGEGLLLGATLILFILLVYKKGTGASQFMKWTCS